MNVGIVGAGHIGGTLARQFVAAGHHVRLGARDLGAAAALAAELGPSASAGSAADAAAFGEVVVVAVPYGAWPELGRALGDALAGKVVVDATNPYAARDGDLAARAAADPAGSGAFAARFVPRARVVKAFNSLSAGDLATRGGRGLGMALAGDDPAAVAAAAALVRDAGLEPVVAGPLAEARRFDAGRPAYGAPLPPAELRAALARGA